MAVCVCSRRSSELRCFSHHGVFFFYCTELMPFQFLIFSLYGSPNSEMQQEPPESPLFLFEGAEPLGVAMQARTNKLRGDASEAQLRDVRRRSSTVHEVSLGCLEVS